VPDRSRAMLCHPRFNRGFFALPAAPFLPQSHLCNMHFESSFLSSALLTVENWHTGRNQMSSGDIFTDCDERRNCGPSI